MDLQGDIVATDGLFDSCLLKSPRLKAITPNAVVAVEVQ